MESTGDDETEQRDARAAHHQSNIHGTCRRRQRGVMEITLAAAKRAQH